MKQSQTTAPSMPCRCSWRRLYLLSNLGLWLHPPVSLKTTNCALHSSDFRISWESTNQNQYTYVSTVSPIELGGKWISQTYTPRPYHFCDMHILSGVCPWNGYSSVALARPGRSSHSTTYRVCLNLDDQNGVSVMTRLVSRSYKQRHWNWDAFQASRKFKISWGSDTPWDTPCHTWCQEYLYRTQMSSFSLSPNPSNCGSAKSQPLWLHYTLLYVHLGKAGMDQKCSLSNSRPFFITAIPTTSSFGAKIAT